MQVYMKNMTVNDKIPASKPSNIHFPATIYNLFQDFNI